MKKFLSLMIAVMCLSQLSAQRELQTILESVEANNTTLAALKRQVEALKSGVRAGISPSNPEVGFNYLWGSPVSVGNRMDVSVTQSFDFPTVYYYKRQIANGKATQAELQYAVERQSLFLQVRKTCVDLTYCNALEIELNKRLQHAQRIAQAYEEKFNDGEANILERNKAQLNLLNAQKESQSNQIERETLLIELIRLNGGKSILFGDTSFGRWLLPLEFDQWYAEVENRNPTLQCLAQEIEITRREEQLSKAQWLPKFSLGYVSERVAGTTQQGIGAGISIPLWEGLHTVKQVQAQRAALRLVEADAKIQFYSGLRGQYVKAQRLQRLVDEYKQRLSFVNSSDLLQQALDKGQISLIDYIIELSLYYDAITTTLQTERELQYLYAELRQWE